MTDGRRGPHVVHGPHHGLAVGKNLVDVLEREHTLVDPCQMDHVRLLILWQRSDVRACAGRVDLEEMVTLEVKMPEDTPPLPQEMQAVTTRMWQAYHRDVVGLFVGHEHFSFHAVVVESFHESVGGHSGSSGLFAGVDNEYAHSLFLYY